MGCKTPLRQVEDNMTEKYKIIAYHCRNCGGIVEPGQEYCDYCSQKSAFAKYDNRKLCKKIRLLVDCGRDFVYFDDLKSISALCYEPQYIDVTSLYDNYKRYIHSEYRPPTLDIEFNLTQRSIDLYNKLEHNKAYNLRLEFLGLDRAFEMKSCAVLNMPSYSPNELITASMKFVADSDLKFYNTVVPDNCSCPNCGAPIKSRYGACDYCGGWIEWSW